mmetsp:Transcript_1957/g.8134  ORF Transcript_1957/g.8134 Transcript_1957/m.8134 type:complete len:240 (-) Transcript_1957:1144-1863(-)
MAAASAAASSSSVVPGGGGGSPNSAKGCEAKGCFVFSSSASAALARAFASRAAHLAHGAPTADTRTSSACRLDSEGPVATATARSRARWAGTACSDHASLFLAFREPSRETVPGAVSPGGTYRYFPPLRLGGSAARRTSGAGCWYTSAPPRARTARRTRSSADDAFTANTCTPPRVRHTTTAPPHTRTVFRSTSSAGLVEFETSEAREESNIPACIAGASDGEPPAANFAGRTRSFRAL